MYQSVTCSNLMLSVLVITYNHEYYIRAALDSVIQQQVNFPIEIVVGEDCSTDGTRAILFEYESRYPTVIRLLFREHNLGISHNWENTMQECKGKYIALLEGDDYWTAPHKLQKQVDFLESHPDYSMCFHNARVTYDYAQPPRASHPMTRHAQSAFTLDDVTRDWSIATATGVFRSELLRGIPGWVHESVIVDLPVFALLASRGMVEYLPEEMSVYRVNDGGVTNIARQETLLLGLVRMHGHLDKELNFVCHHNLAVKTANNYASLAGLMNNEGKYKAARNYLLQSWRIRAAIRVLPTREEVKALAISLFPSLYRITRRRF